MTFSAGLKQCACLFYQPAGLVVRKADNAIQRIARFVLSTLICESDLSGRQSYPAFEQLRPAVLALNILTMPYWSVIVQSFSAHVWVFNKSLPVGRRSTPGRFYETPFNSPYSESLRRIFTQYGSWTWTVKFISLLSRSISQLCQMKVYECLS